MTPDNISVHGLWIGDELSPPEQLCIRSFISQGHQFHLWIYSPVKNIPKGTIVEDAKEIIPYSGIFIYKKTNKFGHGKGSYAGFSDIFRYKLLYIHGGWWSDMDVTCLKPFTIEKQYFLRKNGNKDVVGNLMKSPPQSELMNYCFEKAFQQINSQNTDWMLPMKILQEGINIFHLEKYIMEYTNDDSWTIVSKLLTENKKIPEGWHAIHWMNEEWRRHGLKKNKFIKNTVIEHLLNEHKIKYDIYDKKEEQKIKFSLSKWNYRYISIKARIKWVLNLFFKKYIKRIS